MALPENITPFLEPVAVADESSLLKELIPHLEKGEPVALKADGEWKALRPEKAAGYPPTRQLMDLPLEPAEVLPAEASPAEALGFIHSRVCLALTPEGEVAGRLNSQALLECLFQEADKSREREQFLSASLEMGDSLAWRLPLSRGWKGEIELSQIQILGPLKKILGYSDKEIRALKNWQLLVHPEDLQQVQAANEKLLKEGTKQVIAIRLRTREGTWKWFRSTAWYYKDEKGNPLYFSGLASDITAIMERKREEELEKELYAVLAKVGSRKALERSLALVAEAVSGDFAFIISRESPGRKYLYQARWKKPGREWETVPSPPSECLSAADKRGKIVIVNDTSVRTPCAKACEKRGTRACAVLCLVSSPEFSSWAVLMRAQEGGHLAQAKRLLKKFMPPLAAGVEARRYEQELRALNRKLEDGIKHRTYQLEVLNRIAQNLSTALDYDDLMKHMAENLHQLVEYDIAATLLCLPEQKELLFYARRPVADALLVDLEQRLFESYSVLKKEKIEPEKIKRSRLELMPGRGSEEKPQNARNQKKTGKREEMTRAGSVLVAPFLVGPEKRLVGILLVAAEEENRFTDEHVNFLHTAASQAAVSVERVHKMVSEQRQRLERLVYNLPHGVAQVSAKGEVLLANEQAEHFLALLAEKNSKGRLKRLGDMPFDKLLQSAREGPVELVSLKPERRVFQARVNILPAGGAEKENYVLVLRDITRERNIEIQARTQERLAAVGKLAGGVAHDFNNMLSIILGYTDAIMKDLRPLDPLYEDLKEIRAAAIRSADLTRQLLAFSRKQTISPTVIHLEEQLSQMAKMLRRLIGEQIELAYELQEDTWPVLMDPAQVDQLVANLAVNARDAMPEGGKLVLKTENVILDEEYCKAHIGATPGEYVHLLVADTGVGMDEDTLAHVFEPFFTTKEEGKGTGLGMATVYGIVTQNKGHIRIESEPGKGTQVHIYLPRLTD